MLCCFCEEMLFKFEISLFFKLVLCGSCKYFKICEIIFVVGIVLFDIVLW